MTRLFLLYSFLKCMFLFLLPFSFGFGFGFVFALSLYLLKIQWRETERKCVFVSFVLFQTVFVFVF